MANDVKRVTVERMTMRTHLMTSGRLPLHAVIPPTDYKVRIRG